MIPDDISPPLGKEVVTTTYVDANLYNDLITGHAAIGSLHLVNSTPVDWYSKCQQALLRLQYGSEFVAARIATDQVIDLYLVITDLLLPVQQLIILDLTSSTMFCHTTMFERQLQQRFLHSSIRMGQRIQLIY